MVTWLAFPERVTTMRSRGRPRADLLSVRFHGPQLNSLRPSRGFHKPILRTNPRNAFSFFKSQYSAIDHAQSDPYRRLFDDFHVFGDTVPARRRDTSNDFSFFRAVSGSPIPFRRAPTASYTEKRLRSPHRQRSFSASDADTHNIDAWLKKLYADLDSLDRIAPQRSPYRKMEDSFRNHLNNHFAQRIVTRSARPALVSEVFYSSLCGIIFSVSAAASITDTALKSSVITQSKTFDGKLFQPKSALNDSKSTNKSPYRFSNTTSTKQRPTVRDTRDDALSIYLQRRAEKMRWLTRKLFSVSKDPGAAHHVTAKNGRVKKLSKNFETWQRVRSGCSSPIRGSNTCFSYTNDDDIWTTRVHRIRRSSSSSTLSEKDPSAGKITKSKSMPGNALPNVHSTNNPYRHVGFDLLESSLSLDERISCSSVSSFPTNALDEFHRSSPSCSSPLVDKFNSYIFPGSSIDSSLFAVAKLWLKVSFTPFVF